MKPIAVINIVFVSDSEKYVHYILNDLINQSYIDIKINCLVNSKEEMSSISKYALIDSRINVFYNKVVPTGFCENHNILIKNQYSRYIIILNPDMRLDQDFIKESVKYFESNPKVDFISPKIMKINSIAEILPPFQYDSVGMHLSPTFRHKDIYSNKLVNDGDNTPKRIWGVSGAAIIMRSSAYSILLEKNGEFFDQDYYMGREDADLFFKANNAGLRSVYVPQSIAYHIRTTTPKNRKIQSNKYNYHQLKNRYILMIKHLRIEVLLLFLIPIIIREISILIYILINERDSLKSYLYICESFNQQLIKRKFLKELRKSSVIDDILWFIVKFRKIK
jgi:GT2 family glycosyltransferase